MSENEIYVQPKAMAIAAPQTNWPIDSLQALITGYEKVLTSYIALYHLYFGKGPDTKYKVACGRTQVGGASKIVSSLLMKDTAPCSCTCDPLE